MLIFAGAVASAMAAGLSRGGDYHLGPTLVCSDCHTVHYSETHTLAGAPTSAVPLVGGPHPRLLRQAASSLCLACHDGRTDAPDVLGANIGGYVRAAGSLNRVGETGPYAEANGHTIGSANPAPGGSWIGNQTGGLQCGHCHDYHGNAYYRNLTPIPGGATGKFVTYLTGSTYAGTAAVQQIASMPMATHYAAGNIRYRQTQVGTTDFGLSEWCGGCHGNYHGAGGSAGMGGSPSGDPNGASPWRRHPTRDVSMGQASTNRRVDASHWFGTLQSRVPVVSPSGTPGANDNQPFCGSCHKAHGSTNRYGLIFDDEATAAPEDGTALLQTCQQCHYQ